MLQLIHMRNRWTRTRIDYDPCITSEPPNQVCQSRFIIALMRIRKQITLDIPYGMYTPYGVQTVVDRDISLKIYTAIF